jgi:hypothetical protein
MQQPRDAAVSEVQAIPPPRPFMPARERLPRNPQPGAGLAGGGKGTRTLGPSAEGVTSSLGPEEARKSITRSRRVSPSQGDREPEFPFLHGEYLVGQPAYLREIYVELIPPRICPAQGRQKTGIGRPGPLPSTGSLFHPILDFRDVGTSTFFVKVPPFTCSAPTPEGFSRREPRFGAN